MEKLFEKIGDHFNNPEMSDRILVVKIRKDGWEKLEAARRVKCMAKTNSDGNEDNTSAATNNKPEGKPSQPEESETVEVATVHKSSEESLSTSAATEDSIWDSRAVSSLSCDSGIGGDTVASETKRTVKSKKREESFHVVDKEEILTVGISDSDQPGVGDVDSNVASALNSSPSSDPDLNVAFTKLLITDIRYANKADAIGLTSASSSSFASVEDEACNRATENSVLKTSEEDLAFADTVIREHQLCVHSFWLALNSSYFRSLFFSSGMKETKVKKVSISS